MCLWIVRSTAWRKTAAKRLNSFYYGVHIEEIKDVVKKKWACNNRLQGILHWGFNINLVVLLHLSVRSCTRRFLLLFMVRPSHTSIAKIFFSLSHFCSFPQSAFSHLLKRSLISRAVGSGILDAGEPVVSYDWIRYCGAHNAQRSKPSFMAVQKNILAVSDLGGAVCVVLFSLIV